MLMVRGVIVHHGREIMAVIGSSSGGNGRLLAYVSVGPGRQIGQAINPKMHLLVTCDPIFSYQVPHAKGSTRLPTQCRHLGTKCSDP